MSSFTQYGEGPWEGALKWVKVRDREEVGKVVDGGKNAIYTIRWSGPKGTVFTEAPNDSGVIGFVGTIDMTTGFITPLSTGWSKPTGLIFVPGS